MAQELTLLPVGWITDPNPHSATPPGAASEFSNVIIERRGIVQPRDGFAQDTTYPTTVGNVGGRMFEFQGEFYVWESVGAQPQYDFLIRRSDGAQVFKDASVDVGATQYAVKSTVSQAQFADGANNSYFTTNDGVRRLTTAAGAAGARASLSGVSQGLTPQVSVATGSQYNAWFEPDSAVAYRIVYQKTVNNIPVMGAPSGYTLFKRAAAGGTANIEIIAPIQLSVQGATGAVNIVEGDRLLIYRTRQTYVAAGGGENISPGDEMQLVTDVEITAADIAAGYKTVIDQTADDSLGAFLYTNATLEGILQANNRAPVTRDVASYASSLYYANCTQWNHQAFDIVQPQDLLTLQVTPVSTTVGQPYITLGGAAVVTEEAVGMFVGGFDQFGGGLYVGTPKSGSVAFAGYTQIISVDVPNNRYEVSSNALASFAGGFEGVELHPYIAFVCQAGIDAGKTPVYEADIYWSNGSNPALTPAVKITERQFDVVAADAYQTAQNLSACASRQNDRYFNIYPTGGDDLIGSFIVQEVAPFVSCNDPPSECEAFGAVATAWAPAMKASVIPDPFVFGQGLAFTDQRQPNRVYYSKQAIPEAVPTTNYFDVGSRSHEILRIIRSREALLIFKTDGLYRLTATSTFDQRLDLIDPTYILVHPDAACAFNNQVFAWTTQGVVLISDSGIQQLSLNVIQSQLDAMQRNLAGAVMAGLQSQRKPFAFADETRDIVYLGIPSEANNNYCTEICVYAGRSNTWSKFAFPTAASSTRYIRDGVTSQRTITTDIFSFLSGSGTTLSSRLYLQNPQGYDESITINVAAVTDKTVDITAGSGWTPTIGDAVTVGGVTRIVSSVTNIIKFDVNDTGLGLGAGTAYVGYQSDIQFVAKEAQNPGMLKHWLYVTPVFEALADIVSFDATYYTNQDPTQITMALEVPFTSTKVQRLVRLMPTRQHSRAAELIVKFGFRTALANWEFAGMSLTYNAGSSRVQR